MSVTQYLLAIISYISFSIPYRMNCGNIMRGQPSVLACISPYDKVSTLSLRRAAPGKLSYTELTALAHSLFAEGRVSRRIRQPPDPDVLAQEIVEDF
jgi:hypothetical protein